MQNVKSNLGRRKTDFLKVVNYCVLNLFGILLESHTSTEYVYVIFSLNDRCS